MARNGKIGAVVLAAGASRRFGEPNKLLQHVDGRSLIEHVLDGLAGADVAPLVVVTGWDRDGVIRVVEGRDVRLAHNPTWEAGIGASIGAGIASLEPQVTGALIVPGDMPLMTSKVVAALIDAFERSGGDRVVYPTTKEGEQRNPVLWPRRFFADLEALPPEEGAKSLLKRLGVDDRHAVVIEDERALSDVDTIVELDAVRTREA